MRSVCDYTDFFVIASGGNPRQSHSVASTRASDLRNLNINPMLCGQRLHTEAEAAVIFSSPARAPGTGGRRFSRGLRFCCPHGQARRPVKLLFDENLSRKLVARLAEFGGVADALYTNFADGFDGDDK
jgi:hypothetical protein